MADGISFMMRVRNEEATLEQSVRSLVEHLTIPHEVVIVLHLCTDRSAEIATRLATEFGARVQVFTYTEEVSRAGYETLATDAGSRHSLPTYYLWCRRQCKSRWIFKWDGDFIATPGLIAYLNGRSWLATAAPENVRMTACNADMVNSEIYLSSALVEYGKFYFWEIPLFQRGALYTDAPADARIEHNSLLANMKPFWRRVPWFETEETTEATQVRERVAQLVRDFGPEPVGMARASNPECDPLFLTIKRSQPAYVNPTG